MYVFLTYPIENQVYLNVIIVITLFQFTSSKLSRKKCIFFTTFETQIKQILIFW